MTKRIQTESTRLKVSVLAVVLSLLVACGGGGGSGSNSNETNLVESNPEFLAKAEAVSFSQIRLYQGHVNPDGQILSELDTSNLGSGDLITVDVEFSVTGALADYSVAVQLVPQSIFSQLDQGNTIGEIVNADTQQGEDFIDLGGAHVDEIQPGILHAVVHAKLPLLEQDTVYKVLVTPSLAFLSSGKDINTDDVNTVPVFFDDRELAVSKLDAVSVKIVDAADLTVDNAFTQLEIGGGFDANGFSIEPVFQTSIEVDMTTFTASEEVVLSLSWAQPGGSSFPLGLLTSDVDGNPVISTEAHFSIERTDATSVTIPVVAFATEAAQSVLLKEATDIRDVADQEVQTGDFNLAVFHVENGINIDTGQQFLFSIPLVSQDNRALELSSDQVIDFTVLRAGLTNSACLRIDNAAFDIDTGLLSAEVGATSKIIATDCPASSQEAGASPGLWRYDLATRQIISKETDVNGDNHCLSWIDKPVIPNSFFPVDFNLLKCRFEDSSPGTAISIQRFIFEDNKLRLEIAPVYVDVVFDTALIKEVVATQAEDPVAVTDFFTDSNGADVDQYGRLFHIGKFYDRGWGDIDTARVSLSYGGESYLDYLPVLGTTTEGHVTLAASLFGGSVDLVDARFTHKRYLSKQISSVAGNIYPVEIGNGAEFKVDVAGFAAESFGGIETKTITESYNPLDNIKTMLDAEPTTNSIVNASYKRTVDETFLDITFTVVVVPVNIKGGITGDLDMNAQLNSQGIGLDALVTESLSLGGFLNATAAFVAGITGEVEVINQTLDFTAGGQFEATATLPPELVFNIDSALDVELSLLKGKVTAFVDYPSPCWCAPPFKIKRKEKVLYSSPYLFDSKWSIYSSGTKTFSAIPY